MKNLIGGLVVVWAGLMMIGCGGDVAGQSALRVAQIGNNEKECGDVTGTAVSVSLSHASGVLADDFQVEYRKDDGDWIVAGAPGSGSVPIPGKAGTYLIKVHKVGYLTESALVEVPHDTDCQLLTQAVGFVLTPIACPSENQVYVNVVKPADTQSLGILIQRPNNETLATSCALKQSTAAGCEFNLTVGNQGAYEVYLSGFPNQMRAMLTSERIVRNLYPTIELIVSYGARRHRIVSQAVTKLALRIPYEVGESGCREVNFDDVTAEIEGVTSPGSGTGGFYAGPDFQIAPADSEVCLQPVQKKQISFVMEVPTGTLVDSVKVDYWLNEKWNPANCNFNNELVCRAEFDNPFRGDRYHFRMMVNQEEINGYYLPLMNQCMVFN